MGNNCCSKNFPYLCITNLILLKINNIMKKILIPLVSLVLLASCGANKETQMEVSMTEVHGVAYSDDHVRFTMIADGVIRMEYAPDGKFVDEPSLIASERHYPQAHYNVQIDDSVLIIESPKIRMAYILNSGPFTKENMFILSGGDLPNPFVWRPGMEQQHNLGGTARTLDGYNGDKLLSGEPLPLEKGILARDGWTLIDDSKGLLFEPMQDGDLDWVKTRDERLEMSDERLDWYFMSYGQDYKGALADYTLFAGKIPLPPRYVFGYWWSRYWSYSDAEMRKLVADFEKYDIPLDVLVVDMDWHWTEPGKGGWTGYTWNERLFPQPKKFLDFLKSRGLKITLNLHPADGVPAYEDKYAALAEFLGRDPQSTETIKWQSSDRKLMRGWLDKMLRPLEFEGVDFWWLDWQQKLQDDSIPALSNTWWLNYCIFQNQVLNSLNRPMLYHRWGGLGNHRYQIGFSGDTYSTWESLDYQPYFNTTAANVGYGFWSHDIGGHMFTNRGDVLDQELYTRWMQLGVFLPVMRSHSTKDGNMKKEPWNLQQPYMPVVSETVKMRYRLAPYIYTAAREAYETGVSMCRPLYYDYPNDERAYAAEYRNEYLFGNDILVAPITKPMTDGVSTVDVFLPEGNWYEVATGEMIVGGKVVSRKFLIDEYPMYVKEGAIIAEYVDAKTLAANDNKVKLVIAPVERLAMSDERLVGSGCIYEDNGNDKKYAEKYAVTPIDHSWEGNVQTVKIGARTGSYQGMPARREYAVSLRGVAVPTDVRIDGKRAEWTYDGANLAVEIEMGSIDPKVEHTVVVTYPESTPTLCDGLVGKMRRVANAMTAEKFRNAGIVFVEGFGELGSAAQMIEYMPEQFNKTVGDFNANYGRLDEIMTKQGFSEAEKEWFLKECVY